MFQHLLREETVRVSLDAPSREAAFAELVALLPSSQFTPAQKRDILDLFIQREMFESSSLGDGVAISHASVAGLTAPVAVIGISRRGLQYSQGDAKPVHFVFLAVFPDSPEYKSRKFAALSAVEAFFSDHFLRVRL